MTEVHRVRDLAKMISDMTGVLIQNLPNPRNEDDENDLVVRNTNLIKLGLDPTTLQQGLMTEITEIAEKYSERCDRNKILSTSYWNDDMVSKSA
jgi:UDP-sulfoquinovose synthase